MEINTPTTKEEIATTAVALVLTGLAVTGVVLITTGIRMIKRSKTSVARRPETIIVHE